MTELRLILYWMIEHENIIGVSKLLSAHALFFCCLTWATLFRMLDILEKFLIRKGYCFSRLDGSTPTSLRQSIVDDFNSSPSKQVDLKFASWIRINAIQFATELLFIILGIPDINSCWWAWIEPRQCKPCCIIWSQLESCTRFTSSGQILSLWAEAAGYGVPSSLSWFTWRTSLYSAGVQAAALKHCCLWKDGKTIFWRCSGTKIYVF